MRIAAFSLLLLVLAGCQCLRKDRMEAGICEGCPGPCDTQSVGGNCPQPCPPSCPQPCPPPCKPEKNAETLRTPKQPETVERTTSQSAVTQDVLLIPRMVYVPYAPQVPVAPARLGRVTSAERVLTRDSRETVEGQADQGPARGDEGPKRAAAPERNTEATDQCMQQCMQTMAVVMDKLTALEARLGPCPPAAAPCPTICPPRGNRQPCPTVDPPPPCPRGPLPQ